MPAVVQINAVRRSYMQGYCMKCRTQKEMVDTTVVTMKNGRPATQGRCPACNTKMYRLGKA